jgi:hypothetical protein
MKLHANAALSLKGRRQLATRVVEQGWSLAAAAAAAAMRRLIAVPLPAGRWLQGGESRAEQGRRERRVLGTRATEDAAMRRLIAVLLPAVVGEGLVGLRHPVDVVLALVGAALLLLGVRDLSREALRHRPLAAGAGELHEPAHGEGPGAA